MNAYEKEWERFIHAGGDNSEYYTQTSRLKVPGGWLVRERLDSPASNGFDEVNVSVSICFVPDIHHVWSLK